MRYVRSDRRARCRGAVLRGYVHVARGLSRALDYLRLDPDSEVSKAVSIDVFLREGKEKDVLQAQTAPQWGGYSMLFAFLRHRPEHEIVALARTVQPRRPRSELFFGGPLGLLRPDRCRARDAEQTIQRGYCTYPAIESDPMFTSLRGSPRFMRFAPPLWPARTNSSRSAGSRACERAVAKLYFHLT